MAADSGFPEKVEATPPPIPNPALVPSFSTPALVPQGTPRPKTRVLSKAPPLPVLRFPKVRRGRGLIMNTGGVTMLKWWLLNLRCLH